MCKVRFFTGGMIPHIRSFVKIKITSASNIPIFNRAKFFLAKTASLCYTVFVYKEVSVISVMIRYSRREPKGEHKQ